MKRVEAKTVPWYPLLADQLETLTYSLGNRPRQTLVEDVVHATTVLLV